MRARIRIMTASVLLVWSVAFAAACDAYTEFVVVNESDETVGIGWFYGACTPERELDKRKGPLDMVVEPGEEYQAGGVTHTFPDCVAIRTRDDEAALIAEYRHEGVYVVTGSRSNGTLEFRFLGFRP